MISAGAYTLKYTYRTHKRETPQVTLAAMYYTFPLFLHQIPGNLQVANLRLQPHHSQLDPNQSPNTNR